MNWQHIRLGFLVGVTALNALADSIPYPAIFAYAPITRFQPAEHPRFNLIERELRNLTAHRGDPSINNIFCASGFTFPNGNIRTIVIWTNRDQLYWWSGTTDKQDRDESITLWLSPYSDLVHVAEDGAILGGPTTVNRSQAKAAIEDCEQYGQKFLVKPFTPVIKLSGQEPEFNDADLEYIEN